MKKILSSIILIISSISYGEKIAPCNLEIKVTGIDQSKKGQVCAYFFSDSNKDAFPFPLKKASFFKCIDASDSVIIEQAITTPGDYAFMIVHDEDRNHELKTNWIGMPKEGVYASNGAKGRFGPPSFDDAKISLSKDNCKVQDAKLSYL